MDLGSGIGRSEETSRLFRPERARALRDAFRRAESFGPIRPAAIGLAGGLFASFLVDGALVHVVGAPLRQIGAAAAFVAVMAPVWLLLQPADVRRAQDVVTWLNGWEAERWQHEIGRRLTAVPRATPAMLDALPDTIALRPLRVELLAASGRLEEARERLAQLPRDTAWQRFERTALAEWIAWWHDLPGDRSALRAAAAEVEDGERRLAARAMTAAAEARRAAVEGGDAVAPLAAMRDELGERPRRYAFGAAAGILATVVLTGMVASAVITLGSAVLR